MVSCSTIEIKQLVCHLTSGDIALILRTLGIVCVRIQNLIVTGHKTALQCP